MMGYIAPVNNHQYQQYAERLTMKGYDPYYLTPVNRITPFRRSNEEFQDHLERELDSVDEREEKKQNRVTRCINLASNPSIPPHIIPKFTGKGQYFNQSI